MSYKLHNGLFFIEHNNTFFIPAMDEEHDGTLNFDKTVFPFLYKQMTGDFELCTNFIPTNMSLGDSYGLKAMVDNNLYTYITLLYSNEGLKIKSGICDVFRLEDSDKLVNCENVTLKIVKSNNIIETFYSLDGINFVSCGKNTMVCAEMSIGYTVSSFNGSDFFIKVKN